MKSIQEEFSPNKYNLFKNNCNHFTENICNFITGKSIPEYVLNQIESIKDTGLGQAFIPMLEQMGQESFSCTFEKKQNDDYN